jgi:RimJ/RimL family protein N-acetyltransferase
MVKKKETLKDGTVLLLRTLTSDDIEKLMGFYRSLPYEDRKYLKIDVTDRAAVEKRIRNGETGRAIRILAIKDDEIIGLGVLDMGGDDWHRTQGEIRVVVSRDFQRKGLGTTILRELYLLAVEYKLEKVVAQMMRPQLGARKMCRKLGFREELYLPDYVKDQDKKDQDLVIMTCNTDDLWKEFELLYKDSDWRRCR